MTGDHRDQKKMMDPLELELQKIVSFHVGSGNWILELSKSNKYM